VAIFILNTPTLPSPIQEEGTRGRGDLEKGVMSRHGRVGRKKGIIISFTIP